MMHEKIYFSQYTRWEIGGFVTKCGAFKRAKRAGFSNCSIIFFQGAAQLILSLEEDDDSHPYNINITEYIVLISRLSA